MTRSALALGVALLALGCRSNKSDSQAETSQPATRTSVPAVAPSALPPEPEPPELPTESDYEQEAETQIDGSNLEKQLDQLEKELLGG